MRKSCRQPSQRHICVDASKFGLRRPQGGSELLRTLAESLRRKLNRKNTLQYDIHTASSCGLFEYGTTNIHKMLSKFSKAALNLLLVADEHTNLK